jgi:hypothetical protein
MNMKKLLFLLIVVFGGCASHSDNVRQSISLSGDWGFRIDSLDRGIPEKWYLEQMTEIVRLPGSMAENGKGDEVTVKTKWTGDIIDQSYFTEEKYAKYRQPGNIKIPFWLKPVKYYKGAAWYQKTFELPAGWKDKHVSLFLERPHWESTVFVNGKEAGKENSLAVPHQFDISGLLVEGKNTISIRIDNRVIIPVGNNSHSISDHTQSDWNGIAGEISLKATSGTYIGNVDIYPDIEKKRAKIIVRIINNHRNEFNGKLQIQAVKINPSGFSNPAKVTIGAALSSDNGLFSIDYPMGQNISEWDEFNPNLYALTVTLKEKGKGIIDCMSENFGMREFKAKGTRFEVNGIPVFLRGTTECCVFPLTGYPPTDTASWGKVLRICREYGLNHIRFHSYCPPEAAFEMADRLGMYFHIECSSWANQGASIGDGKSVDKFIYEEGDRIISEYGNHPSFCMLAYGNEPAGNNQKAYLGRLLTYWKDKDNRRVYTSAAGWPVIDQNDYNLTPGPRIQQWGDGLKSVINAQPPQTMYDFSDFVSKYAIPVVSHEIGQWCAYPDFKEIDHYTGPLKATNFEIFRETLTANHMGDQAENFLMASGRLQSLCYKAEIEAALRTPGFAGFEMLQLHDFPGQGTALVGILNSFFESKGYITPQEFRMFCNETVPLARIPKFIYRKDEEFVADLEIFNFGKEALHNTSVLCYIINNESDTLFSQSIAKDKIERGNCIPAGSFHFKLEKIEKPQKLSFVVSLKNTRFKNKWDFWVYPASDYIDKGNVLITDNLNQDALSALKNGKPVLLLSYGKVGKNKGADIAIGFSSIFWNTAWTHNQAPHTLGILCNPEHPLFRSFPTEYHSNWQWWDPVTHSQAMIIDGLPENMKPLIQPIDTWFENRRLALAFECSVNNGKLLVCSIDLKNIKEDRIVSRQLLKSILGYMNSPDFSPQDVVSPEKINQLQSNK